MTASLHHQVNVTLNRKGLLRRRDFLRAIPAVTAAAGTLSWHDLMTAQADQLRKARHGLYSALDAGWTESV